MAINKDLDNQINRMNKMLQSAARIFGTSSTLYDRYATAVRQQLSGYDGLLKKDKNGVVQISRSKLAAGYNPTTGKMDADRAGRIKWMLNITESRMAKENPIKEEKKRIIKAVQEQRKRQGSMKYNKPVSPQEIQVMAAKQATLSNRMDDVLKYIYAHENKGMIVDKQTRRKRYTGDSWKAKRALGIMRKKGSRRTYEELQRVIDYANDIKHANAGNPDVVTDVDFEDIL